MNTRFREGLRFSRTASFRDATYASPVTIYTRNSLWRRLWRAICRWH